MTEPDIRRGDIWWIGLDPTQGSEISKTRPCVILTHDTLNRLRRTVVVIPLSTAAKPHPPITIPVSCQGKAAVAVIDQIRAVAKHRLRERIETMPKTQFEQICRSLSTILEIK